MSQVSLLDLIEKHTARLPVNVDALIREAGLELQKMPLAEDVAGWIERRSDNRYRIVVNTRHTHTRQRFTAAHELGHYIYHRDLLGDGVADSRGYRGIAVDNRLNNPSILIGHERQANLFAVNLLIPGRLLDDLPRPVDVTAAASAFEVSPEVMGIRLGLVKTSMLPPDQPPS